MKKFLIGCQDVIFPNLNGFAQIIKKIRIIHSFCSIFLNVSELLSREVVWEQLQGKPAT